MIVSFAEVAWEDFVYWQKIDKKIIKKITLLIQDIKINPDDKNGLGKPEMLKGNFSGYLSRRIDEEHRLVYKVVEDNIFIVQCRYHYSF